MPPKRAEIGVRKGYATGSSVIDEIMRRKQMDPATLEKAKAAAPRWDVYSLESQFWTWLEEESISVEKDPRAMFIAFCRNHAKSNRA